LFAINSLIIILYLIGITYRYLSMGSGLTLELLKLEFPWWLANLAQTFKQRHVPLGFNLFSVLGLR